MPVVIPASRRLYWSVRRELWENRSIYLAPLAVAALFLVAFLIASFIPRSHVTCELATPSMQAPGAGRAAVHHRRPSAHGDYLYCRGVLLSRRAVRRTPRSQHPFLEVACRFPISPLCSRKPSIPILILPLITFAIALVTQCIMLLLSSAVMLARGQSVADAMEPFAACSRCH